MLKRRVLAVEKRLAGLDGTTRKNFRLVYQFAGDPEPQAGPDEELLVVEIVNTKDDEAEDDRVLRFDFGGGEGEKK